MRLTEDQQLRLDLYKETLDTGKSLFFDHHDAEATKMFMGWR